MADAEAYTCIRCGAVLFEDEDEIYHFTDKQDDPFVLCNVCLTKEVREGADAKALVKQCLSALNDIPNYRIKCLPWENSYALASYLGKVLRGWGLE